MMYTFSISACELPSTGDGIPHQAAASGISVLRHAQLRHATEGVLAQTVPKPARQVLQVGFDFCLTGWFNKGCNSRPLRKTFLLDPKHKGIYLVINNSAITSPGAEISGFENP